MYRHEGGLYYYRARYYKPEIGRFLQPDPIGYADGLNMYAYCGNNPINWIDPLGLNSIGERIIGIIGGDGWSNDFEMSGDDWSQIGWEQRKNTAEPDRVWLMPFRAVYLTPKVALFTTSLTTIMSGEDLELRKTPAVRRSIPG